MIKLATLFSGIGAVEQALKRMNIPFEIVFACDNGERYLKQSFEKHSLTIYILRRQRNKTTLKRAIWLIMKSTKMTFI